MFRKVIGTGILSTAPHNGKVAHRWGLGVQYEQVFWHRWRVQMRLKVIACEVLMREICYCTALSLHTIDLEFTEKDSHDQVELLRNEVQEKIDATGEGEYDAILLGYGLCGNGTVGLKARHTPLVIPRAHDCCTLFLGSRLKFEELFSGSPSQPFSSLGYMERGDSYVRNSTLKQTLGLDRTYEDYVAQYGEENAKFIMETLHPTFLLENHGEKVVYIEIPETAQADASRRFREKAEADGKEFVKVDGQIGLIRNLLNGNWNNGDYLLIPPGHVLEGVYDWQEICRATSSKETNDEDPDSQ